MQINTLTMTTEREGRWIRLVGDVSYATIEQVRASLADPRVADVGPIVLDLREVSFIGSMGLEVLVDLAARQGPEGVILLLNPAVEEVLSVTGLRERFRVAESETDADRLLAPAA